MALAGRNEEVERLVSDCMAGRFVVLTHEPGMGATELMRAGLAPALRAVGAIPVVFRSWEGRALLTEMTEAVADAVREQADDRFLGQGEPLRDLLLRVRRETGRPVALLLDQFEDYLRFHARTDFADEFDGELAQAVNSRSGLFIVGLQAHSLRPFERLAHLIPNLNGFQMQLKPLSRTAAVEMVKEQAEAEFVVMEASVAEALAGAACAKAGDGVNPWLVSQGARQMIDAAGLKKSTTATAAALAALGGAEKLILGCMDSVFEKLNPTHQSVLFRWFEVLVSTNGYRLSVTEQVLIDRAGKDGRFAATLLPILLGDGVLRAVQVDGVVRYELARESLTVILKDWWTRHEAAMVSRARAKFRMRSMSIAAGCILALYVAWLYLTWK
jgi:hypothetical protein